jgi:hypothetical protein
MNFILRLSLYPSFSSKPDMQSTIAIFYTHFCKYTETVYVFVFFLFKWPRIFHMIENSTSFYLPLIITKVTTVAGRKYLF